MVPIHGRGRANPARGIARPRIVRVLDHLMTHPLSSGHRIATLTRFLRWQIASRLVPGPVIVSFIDDAVLVLRPGETGATGNYYTGLHEFEHMAFVLHALRPGDLFVDVGANVGSYTVLATVAGAACIAVEPAPETYERLIDCLNANRVQDRVEAHRVALGRTAGEQLFTAGLNTTNHILSPGTSAPDAHVVPIAALDELLSERCPTVIKIDVEGFESEVLAGATSTLLNPELLAIVIEVGNASERYGSSPEDVIAILTDCGFASYRYEPKARRLERSPTAPTFRAQGWDAQRNLLFLRNEEEVIVRISDAPRRKLASGQRI